MSGTDDSRIGRREEEKEEIYNPHYNRHVWVLQNKARRNYLSARGTARSFIMNKATQEDLEELESMIAERKKEL